MKARRELTSEEITTIKNYRPRSGNARFPNKQLIAMGFSPEGGGLVRINGQIYSFVSNLFPESDPSEEVSGSKSYLVGIGGVSGKVKLLQNIEHPKDKKVIKMIREVAPKGNWKKSDLLRIKRELAITAALKRGSEEIIKKIGWKPKNLRQQEQHYGVLDFIPGVKILSFLKQNPHQDLEKRLHILLAGLKEMQWIHSKGFTHNDLNNLDNILYDDETGTVKIIDFGEAASLTQTAQGIGDDLVCFAHCVMAALLLEETNDHFSPSTGNLRYKEERDALQKILLSFRKAGSVEFKGDRFALESDAIKIVETLLINVVARKNMSLQEHGAPIRNDVTGEMKFEIRPELAEDKLLSDENNRLLQDIDFQIKKLQKKGKFMQYVSGARKNPSCELQVLDALKKAMNGEIGIVELKIWIQQKSNQDKGLLFFKDTNTRIFIQRVLKFKEMTALKDGLKVHI